MAENSWHWGGVAVGDAGPYDNDGDWSDIWRKLLTSDRAVEGIIAGYVNELEVTNPSGQTIRVAPGMAIVDGKWYESDANEDTLLVAPGAGTDYYLMVLRKDFAAQTVRQTLLGPVAGGPAPSPTQVDGTTWDVPLAEVRITNAGAVTVIDKRRFAQTPLAGQALIGEEILAAAVATVTFDNIPQMFSHLRIVGQARGTVAADIVAVRLQFNSDVGNNYDTIMTHIVEPATLGTSELLASSRIDALFVAAANIAAGVADTFAIEIPNYRGTAFQKGVLVIGQEKRGVSTGDIAVVQTAGWWRSTAAITRIDILVGAGNFAVGSTFSLYGLL